MSLRWREAIGRKRLLLCFKAHGEKRMQDAYLRFSASNQSSVRGKPRPLEFALTKARTSSAAYGNLLPSPSHIAFVCFPL